MKDLYFFIEKNPTVVVSITAIIFTFLGTLVTLYFTRLNTKEQLKTQLATTTEKEWINNVRSALVAFDIDSTHYMITYAHRKATVDDDLESWQLAQFKFLTSKTQLLYLLDMNNPLEAKVITYVTKISNLSGESTESLIEKLPKLQFGIQAAAHNLFNSYRIKGSKHEPRKELQKPTMAHE